MPNPLTFLTRVPKRTIKTITFSNAVGAGQVGSVAVATVTGLACIQKLGIQCLTTLVSAGGGTIALGTAGNTSGIIGATTATALTNTAGTQPLIWVNTTPVIGVTGPVGATVNPLTNIFINLNLIITVAVATITAGVLEFDIEWVPLSNNSLIT